MKKITGKRLYGLEHKNDLTSRMNMAEESGEGSIQPGQGKWLGKYTSTRKDAWDNSLSQEEKQNYERRAALVNSGRSSDEDKRT